MTRSLHFARLAMALAAATAIDACAPVRVRSYVPRGVRFAHYRTYAWSAATPHATGDPRLDANPFDISHLAVGCCLSYVDFRFSDLGWRETRPALTLWHEAFAARGSARATEIVDG